MHDVSFRDFQVLGTLGSGSFGQVYLARRRTDGAKLVIKRVPCTNITQANRALSEARVLLSLNHPHIVKYNNFFLEQAMPGAGISCFVCTVMEYCPGGDLERLLKTVGAIPLPEAQLLVIARSVCLALEHLQSKGIIHRDLKPGNVFVGEEGVLKIGDLGVARSLQAPVDLTSSVQGTPLYMAPEVMAATPYSFPADMWSLGAMLFELASGFSLYRRWQQSRMLLSHIRDQRPLYQELVNRGYSPPVCQLIISMMSLNPDNRPTPAAVLHAKAMMVVTREAEMSLLDTMKSTLSEDRENSNYYPPPPGGEKSYVNNNAAAAAAAAMYLPAANNNAYAPPTPSRLYSDYDNMSAQSHAQPQPPSQPPPPSSQSPPPPLSQHQFGINGTLSFQQQSTATTRRSSSPVMMRDPRPHSAIAVRRYLYSPPVPLHNVSPRFDITNNNNNNNSNVVYSNAPMATPIAQRGRISPPQPPQSLPRKTSPNAGRYHNNEGSQYRDDDRYYSNNSSNPLPPPMQQQQQPPPPQRHGGLNMESLSLHDYNDRGRAPSPKLMTKTQVRRDYYDDNNQSSSSASNNNYNNNNSSSSNNNRYGNYPVDGAIINNNNNNRDRSRERPANNNNNNNNNNNSGDNRSSNSGSDTARSKEELAKQRAHNPFEYIASDISVQGVPIERKLAVFSNDEFKKLIQQRCEGRQLNILLVGEPGHGKSSLVNSLYKVFRHPMTRPAMTSSDANANCTLQLLRYDNLPFVVWDTMGVSGGSKAILKMLFNGELQPNESMQKLRRVPIVGSKKFPPHCVILVVRGTLEQFPNALGELVRELSRSAHHGRVPIVGAITFCDDKRHFNRDLADTVRRVSGAEEVFPISNYTSPLQEPTEDYDNFLLNLAFHAVEHAATLHDHMNRRR